MSVLIFLILCALSGVGVYEWASTIVVAVKQKSMSGSIEGFWLVPAVVVGVLAGTDLLSAMGISLMVLAALHQTFKRLVAWWLKR